MTNLPDKHMWRFFSADTDNLSEGTTISLSAEESQMVHVLRLQKDAAIEVGNGNGQVALATIVKADRKATVVKVESLRTSKLDSAQIHLHIGKSKPTALEESTESAAQMGAQTLQIYTSEKAKNKQSLKFDRLEKIARESNRISKSAFSLSVAENDNMNLRSLAQSLNTRETPKPESIDVVFICDESPLHDESQQHPSLVGEIQKRLRSFESAMDFQHHVHIIVGPEGGFSEEERELLQSIKGSQFVLLGSRILTVPNAVRYAVSVTRAMFELP